LIDLTNSHNSNETSVRKPHVQTRFHWTTRMQNTLDIAGAGYKYDFA